MKKEFCYKAFNFVIYSEVPINKLHEAISVQGNNKLYIKQGNVVCECKNILFERRNIRIFDDGFIFQPGTLYFSYKHSEQTIYFKNSEHRLFEAYILGPIIALVSAFHEFIPLHASGLVVRNISMLLLGNSGSGKSTLLYEILKKHKGFYFSDDLVLAKKQNNLVTVVPSYPEIKLWQDAVDRLSADKICPVYHKINKYYIKDENRFLNQHTTPNILIFLQTSTQSDIQVDKVSGSQKWLYLNAMIYRKLWIESVFQKEMFEVLSQLSNQCIAYKIVRPLNVQKEEWEKTLDRLLNEILL